MTTDGGSVWDRGPSDDGPDPAAPSGDDNPTGEEMTDESTDDASPVDTAGSDEGTVWSRGPSIDETLRAAQYSRPSAPEPVLPPPAPIAARARAASHVRRPVTALALVAVAALTVALAWMLGVVGEDDVAPAIAGATTSPLLPVVTAPSSSTPAAEPTPTPTTPATMPTTMPTTSAPSPATTTTTTTTPTTTSTSSTTKSTTTSSTTSTTTSSTTSTTTTTTTAPPSTTAAAVVTGPTVQIVGRTGPCKFGSDCLIADFSIADFTSPQREFVCEFGGGDRYTFRFDGVSAEAACATSAVDGSITIEVGGVRSETVTR